MKKKLLLFGLGLFALASCTRIDAGHEGILIKQYGSDKGVQDVSLVTGRVWYNPWTEDVDQYATYVLTADYDTFSVNAKDGSIFRVDPMLSYRIIPGKSPSIYTKYRKSLEEIQYTVMFNYVKDAFKNIFNTYTTDSILSRRQEFDNRVTKLLKDELLSEGFEVEQLTFGMRYPKTITDAIDAKNKSVQDAQKAENDLKTSEMLARKKIIEAEADKKANELKQQSLTPLLIQQQFIDKWDGSTPLYGNAPALFKNIQ